MKIDAATTSATDYCYSLKLLLQKQQPKNQKQQQQTNKQTRRSKNLQFSKEEERSKDKFRASLLF